MIGLKNCDRQIKLIKNYHKDTRVLDEGHFPITARSFNYYAKTLFIDKKKNTLIRIYKDKNVLDIGCGINHIYNDSFTLIYFLIVI